MIKIFLFLLGISFIFGLIYITEKLRFDKEESVK